MATNCLITKLDAKVDNSNLPRLNSAVVSFTKSSGDKFAFYASGTNLTILTPDTGHFTDSTGEEDYGTTVTNSSGLKYIKTTGVCNMLIDNLHLLTSWSTNSTSSSLRKYIKYEIKSLLQGNPTVDVFNCGGTGAALLGQGDACTGDVTNISFIDAGTICLSGCDKLVGSMNNIVQTALNTTTKITFYGTKLSFDTQYLSGKNGLYIWTSNTYSKGDVKYFGDTANKAVVASQSGSNYYTGTVEELVERLVAQGRTGGTQGSPTDYFGFLLTYGTTANCFQNITYLGEPLSSYYNSDGQHPNDKTIKFTWYVDGNDEIHINYVLQSTEINVTG